MEEPHLNKQEEKIQKQMEKQFSDDTNREWEERFDERFPHKLQTAPPHQKLKFVDKEIKSFIQEELTRERERIIQSIWLGISQTSGARTYRSVEIIDFIKDYAYEEGIELIPKEE